MKNKLKSEKGIMAVYVTMASVTFVIILSLIFSSAVVTRKNQIKTLIKIKEVYEYDNEKINKIDSYRRKLNTDEYVQDGLVVFYDAINNTGSGHSNLTNIWKDLSGNGYDATHVGTEDISWNDDFYNFINPNTNYFETTTQIKLGTTERTVEIVCSIEDDEVINLVGLGTLYNYNMNDIIYYSKGINFNVYGNQMNEGIDNTHKIGETNATSITYKYNSTNNSYTTTYYSNSQTKTSTFYSLNTGASTLKIGIGNYTEYNKNKQFKIKSLRIYNRALTEEEIQTNYQLDKSRYAINET